MRLFLLAIIVALLTQSCTTSRVPLTVQSRKTLEEAGVPLDKIQFYTSEEIVLSRELRDKEISISGGKVKFKDGRKIEEVVIPGHTPGVCESFDERMLKVSFEQGEGRQLVFLVERKNGVVSSESGFKIAAKEWTDLSNGGRIGKVDYQGKVFNIVRGTNSRLLFDNSVLRMEERNTHVVKGRKL